MESSIRWGALLLASCSLVPPGCAGPSLVTPTPTPAPPSPASTAAAVVEPPAPEEKPADVGPLVLMPPGSPVAHLPGEDVLTSASGKGNEWSYEGSSIRYGRGRMVLRRYKTYEQAPYCPLAGAPPGCTLFALTKTEGESAGTFRPTPHPWDQLTGGRDAIYARTKEAIERIDEQGHVTRFIEDEFKAWSRFWVFEHGDRVRLVFDRWTDRALNVTEVLPAEKPGQVRRLAASRVLPVARIPGRDAQAARMATEQSRMGLAGDPVFVALPKEGAERWAMVWLEVIPPPYGPYDRTKSKHGCGRPSYGPSRALGDSSMEKKAHVTRFNGPEQVSDTVLWSKRDLDPLTTHLEAKLEGDEIQVTVVPGASSDEAHGAVADKESKPEPGRNEQLLGASFDQASQEGVIAVLSGEQLFHRRFDAEGKFLGDAVAYSSPLPPSNSRASWHLHRIGSGWFLSYGNSILSLSAGTPFTTPLPDTHQILALAEEKGRPLLLSVAYNWVHATATNAEGKPAGGPTRIVKMPEDYSPYLSSPGGVWQAAGELPWLGVYTHRGTQSHLYWAQIKAGSRWTKDILLMKDNLSSVNLFFVALPGDLATVASIGSESRSEATVAWWQSGRITQQKLPRTDQNRVALPLPVAGTGALEVRPDLAGAERECPSLLVTGKATFLACASGTDPSRPGVKVSLRKVGPAPSGESKPSAKDAPVNQP